MLFIIESIILCIIFTLIVVPPTLKDPLKQVFNYPPVIQDRVKSLPQYKDKIPTQNKKISLKILGVIIFIIVFTIVVYFSGARTFSHAFIYAFGLFMVGNVFDVLVLDIILFCHDKRFRIPGTEDMVKEYESPWFHIMSAAKGTAAGGIISVITGCIIVLIK